MALLGGVAACDDTDPMASQPRAEAFRESAFFDDGRAMRPLVPGTVAQEWGTLAREDPARRQGLAAGGGWIRAVPVPLTRELLETGRGTYDTWCAVCHGLTGDGDSLVARKMPQRRPPGLFVPHDHATQEVYGTVEAEAPYTGTQAVAARVGPGAFPLPREVDGWGAVRDTRGGADAGTLGASAPVLGAGDAGVPAAWGASSPGSLGNRPPRIPGAPEASAVTAAEAARARQVALVGPRGIAMEGRLDEPSATGDLPHPVGFYFSVISEGFGVMPAYGAQLSPDERWAVVAYLRALGRSQRAPLSAAPADVRARLRQEVHAP